MIRAHPESHIGKLIVENGRPYEYPMLEHIYERKFKGVAVDVGAHIGNHALFFAAVCGLQVVAFEPLFGKELRENVELNGLGERIRIEGCALGSSTGWASDSRERVITEPGSTARSEGRLVVGKGTVRVRPLDTYELEDVSVIKIDVEGMEPYVLRGAKKTIRRCRPVIYAEAPGQRERKRIARVLEPLRYKMTQRFKNLTPREEWSPL